MRRVLLVAAASAAVCGCAVGPRYHRPDAPTTPAWQVEAPWRASAPRDGLPKGQWWSVFQDPELDRLESTALAANQSLKIAAARYDQSRALATLAIAALFPQVGVSPSAARQRLSGNRPSSSATPVAGPVTQTTLTLPFTASYEVDLVGRGRRSVEAARAAAQASAADLENVRLLVTAEVAQDYFALRQLDSELATFARSVEGLEKGLDLVKGRHQGGIASGLDVAQEETLLYATRTQATLLRQSRKQLEDALAVLVGQPAPAFAEAGGELTAEPPSVAIGVPSDLLERRPDVASAERQMAAANAQIGVARGAYFPSLTLGGSAGWQSTAFGTLLNAPSVLWSAGATLAETIFSGGARRARVKFAEAGYQAAVASYRETVLVAFQEVQDAVTGLQVLDAARETQAQAVAASQRSYDLANTRYVGGLVSYLDVIRAQEDLLSNQRQMAAIQGQRLVTSVLLVKALGGGWDAASLDAVQVRPGLANLAP